MMIALISIALSSVAWMLSRGMPAPRRRYEIATAVAVLMAAIGLIPFVVLPHARSPWPFASTSPDPNAKIRNTEVVRDSHAGVILVADTKLRVTTLVAPTPASWRAPATTHLTEPLEIPFDGVYWFYRPPAIRPPQRSVILHGQPDIESFRSPDYYPMVMEGRQNLGRPLDLSCCSEIRVSIRNADRYPGSVEMELRLINTLADGRPSLSLGREQVTTVVPTIAGKATPQREQLTFQIPTPAPITRFDELHVRFHMHRRRSYRSAKIAIDRFVLEPRRL